MSTTSAAPSSRGFTAADAPLVLEEVRSLSALHELRPAWERLLARAPYATPFQSAEWLIPWAELFGAEGLLVLAAWRGGDLVGLAPLRADEGPDGITLSFLGRGISDYSGFLVLPSEGEHIARALWHRLLELRRRWDVCDLNALPPGDPAFHIPLPAPLREVVQDEDVCPYLPLPGAAGQLVDVLPHRMGHRALRYLRRLQREGELRFELADPSTVDAHMDDFFRLHTARWENRQLPGVLADEDVRTFHCLVAHGMCARGRLRLHALRWKGQVCAMVYAFVHGRRVYSYLSGFDPELASYSLGTVSIFHALRHAVDEGCEVFDFLRGDEAYKYRWGAVNRTNRRRIIRVDDELR
jgi:CelD/BcsL family acetyltransferase involved in cellulose biosynthesis